MDPTLPTAIARLALSRASWNEGDEIDEDSKLTADDLDVILAALGGKGKLYNLVMPDLR